MDEKDINRLEKYFQKENTHSEFLEELFEDESNLDGLKKDLGNKWDRILKDRSDKIDLNHILYKIHFNINSKSGKQKVRSTKQLYRWVSGIAVIIVIPLLIWSVLNFYNDLGQPVQYTEIIAPKGEKARFILPDGSIGYLNSGTSLKYAFPFSEKRLVELSGEAFFDIVHDKSEFVVQAQGVEVKVHGTRFNVSAYEDELEIMTTLEEGSVSVVRSVDGKGLTLKPGQQAILDKSSNRLAYKSVNVDLYVSWKDNMLRFQNTPFIDVVKKMERWYDVKIILDDQLKYTQSYTMTIKTESLREMLDLMKVTTPLDYRVKEDIVYITNKKNANELKL